MIRWIPYVFVRFVFFFIAGILAGIYFPDSVVLSWAWIIFLSAAGLFIVLVVLQRKLPMAFNPGAIGLLAIAAGGYTNVGLHTASYDGDNISYVSEPVAFYEAVILSYPQEKEKVWKATAAIRSVHTGVSRNWKPCSGNVLLYFRKDDFIRPYRYGDVLVIRGKPDEVPAPANPHEFDYKRFLAYRNIYHQQFLRESDVRFLHRDPPSVVTDVALTARERAQTVLKKYVSGTQEQAIVSALVLGVTDGLDNDLVSAYAASGAMHVLAVSGLHVGIIYWILVTVLAPLRATPAGRWALVVISIMVLWSYAFVTGLSPSVLRAVTMFSFLTLAQPWGRRTNIYNTLSVSAFCLLLYDPFLIMSVGFQLSYLAVLGIVYLYPRIYGWWQPAAWLPDKVWQTTCVSLAAQAATFPLGLLYFHQFPVYFLFSNLLVIPLSFLVLIQGLVLLIASFVTPLAQVIGYCLTWIVRLLNGGVFIIESLPFSLIDNLYITSGQCLALTGIVFSITLLFTLRKLYYLWISLSLAMVFSAIQWNRRIETSGLYKIIVYKVPGHSAIDLMAHEQTYFFSDPAFSNSDERLRFHVQPNRLVNGIEQVRAATGQPFMQNFKGCKLFLWKQSEVLFIEDKNFDFAKRYPVDYVILARNAIKDLGQVRDKVTFGQLIIDSSNSWYVADKLLKQATDSGLRIHSVVHAGAFEVII